MLFTSYQCKIKYVTDLCSATVVPLSTAIVYKCSQCKALISGYDLHVCLKYPISKNCMFCGRIDIHKTLKLIEQEAEGSKCQSFLSRCCKYQNLMIKLTPIPFSDISWLWT